MNLQFAAYRLLALLIASNYFAFRVELFSEEELQNNPLPQTGASLSAPSVNWETFDKENAPKAFAFNGNIQIEFIGFFVQQHHQILQFHPPFQLVRDKSPPLNSPKG